MPIRDVFLLQCSEKFYLPPRENATVDLFLKKVPPVPNTKLTGQVLSHCQSVPKALVQIFSPDYEPVTQTVTDSEGKFSFIRKLLPGEYYLITAADDYKTSKEYPIFLPSGSDLYLTIKLTPSNLFNFGTVYGSVVNGIGHILPHAKVVISDYNNPNVIKAVTHSDAEGDYLIYGLKPGKYFISAFKDGYEAPSEIYFEIDAGEMTGIDICLYEIIASRVGTISGKITFNGQDYPYAIAALYKVEGNKQELIKIKESNSNGLYLFTNVLPGQYLVKSKIENINRICNKTCVR